MSTPITPSNEELIINNAPIPTYQEQAGEAYMNPQQQAHLQKILEYERQRWMTAQKRTAETLVEQQTRLLAADFTEVATWEAEMRNTLRIQGRQRRLIDKINATLRRFSKTGDNYGFCDACGNPIGIRRLEARPTANLCVDCKTLDEIREKQNGS
jgi:DnaK suppressor protein